MAHECHLAHYIEGMEISGGQSVGHDSRFAYPDRNEHFVHYGGPSDSATLALEAPFVVVDVETSGLEPHRGARIIEIAAIKINSKGEVLDSFHTLVNPTNSDVGMTSIHGVTLDMVQNAPTFGEIADHVKSMLDGAIFVAHHALFDEKFVASEFEKSGHDINTMPGLCTYWLSREIHEKTDEFPNHKLETLTRRYQANPGTAHSAYSDAMVVAQILPPMLGQFGEVGHYIPATHQVFSQPNAQVLRPRMLSLFD